MAATFGNLNLEELGVVGTPEVQYAAFETEVSQPRGYDGGVLANFRRAATSIKFNLTLAGTRDEMHDKINTLAAELAKGKQELILPGMTPGYHFNAAANCILQPAEHIDGFILPLEFTVPEGQAVATMTRQLQMGDTFENTSIYPSPWKISGRAERSSTRVEIKIVTDEQAPALWFEINNRQSATANESWLYYVDSDGELSVTGETTGDALAAEIRAVRTDTDLYFGQLPSGELTLAVFSETANTPTLTWDGVVTW